MTLDELRALVRQRHRAATNKVSRLRSKGVEVGGTDADVRRDPAKIKRYTRPQLESYLRQLNGFTARSNSFIAGAEGARIPGALWREYQRQERAYNRKGDAWNKAVGNIKLLGQDMTIAQRSDTMRPNVIRAGGEATNKPFAAVNRKASSIPGVAELQKLIETYKKKNARDYLPAYLQGQRKQAIDMLKELNLHEQIEDIKNLSNDQFDVLFNDTPFAGDLGQRYASMRLIKSGNRNPAFDAIMNSNEVEISAQISWAKNLPKQIRRK